MSDNRKTIVFLVGAQDSLEKNRLTRKQAVSEPHHCVKLTNRCDFGTYIVIFSPGSFWMMPAAACFAPMLLR